MLTIGEAILKSAEYLKGKEVDVPRLDAELLLCHVLTMDRLHLYMDWQKPLHELEIAAYRECIRRRGQDREPVSRITGKREFFGREFQVTPATFVPRPETEGVVERALMILESESDIKAERSTVFEIGTGTGCIIVSIAAETDGHHFIATDISEGALDAARKNAKKHSVLGRIEFRQGACFNGFEGTLSLIVSNPPYIRHDEIPDLMPEVAKYDPITALDGGEDGMDVVRIIAKQGADLLQHGGWVVLELDSGQPSLAAPLFEETGAFHQIKTEKDLAGHERYLLARRI
jgi:release factor glutamine methyltransferase